MPEENHNIIVKLWVWFQTGYTPASIVLAIGNMGMLLITLLTVKGIYIPLWMICVIGGLIASGCIVLGHFWFTRNVQKGVQSYMNKNGNPEFKHLCDEVTEIKRLLQEVKK